MRLALLYTIFNGTELLKPSIQALEKHVDGVMLCYQEISNKGNVIDPVDMDNIIKGQTYLDTRTSLHADVIRFTPEPKEDDKVIERNKHNAMIRWAVDNGYTHALMMATDHFYEEAQFVAAKDRVEELDVDVTFTKMFTYYKYPTWQLVPIEDYLCTFIVKLSEDIHIAERQYPAAYHVDPSVRLSPADKFHTFQENQIMMHHYSMVRNDISNKLNNAAIYRNKGVEPYIEEWEGYDINSNPGVTYFHGRKIKAVNDIFGLSEIIN